MSDPYLIDCGGFCRSVWELYPPTSILLAGMMQHWLWSEGWSRSATGAWICPNCGNQEEENDHA